VAGCPLMYLKHLDVEYQRRVRWDTREGFAAVGQASWDGDSSCAADGHACDADIPAFDDFAGAEGEGEWFAFLVGYKAVSVCS